MMSLNQILTAPELEVKVAKAISEARFSMPANETYYADPGWRGVFHREAQAIIGVIQAATADPESSQISAHTQASSTTLPPDIDGTNGNRAQWAKAALEAFLAQTGVEYEDALGDLLGDLMHLSDREPFDFEAALERARGHYAAETGSAPY
jgi:hypothetical protein